MSTSEPGSRVTLAAERSRGTYARTSWGEEATIRLSPSDTGARLTILDYAAPAGISPPRHVHREEDETLLLIEGRMVLWAAHGCMVAGPGDLIFLPRKVPHTWRAFPDTSIRATLILNPSAGFERFFPPIQARGLEITDISGLVEVCNETGMDVTGPPLNDDEFARIAAGEDI